MLIAMFPYREQGEKSRVDFGMAIGPGGSLVRPRLIGSAGRVLPAHKQKFALDLKQGPFRSR
jgi:hypothetical protein